MPSFQYVGGLLAVHGLWSVYRASCAPLLFQTLLFGVWWQRNKQTKSLALPALRQFS